MGDVVVGAAREIWGLFLAAVTSPGPYLVAGLVIVAAASTVFVRGKLAALVWIPALTLAGILAWRRFIH